MTSKPESEAQVDGPEQPEPANKPEVADERLLNAHDLARAALHEVTAPATVGEAAGYTLEDGGVVSLRFHNTMEGYPGWFWTVSIAVVEASEPTVLEVELLPGDGALLAPEWVPWAVRLSEYQAAQTALAEAEGTDEGADDDDDEPEELEDLDDLDAADFDEDGSSILHAGDVDGVDIDALDEDADDDDDSDDSGDDDSDDDEDDSDDDDDEDDDDSDDDDSDDDDESDEDDDDDSDDDSDDDHDSDDDDSQGHDSDH
jgi:hypothetical protein